MRQRIDAITIPTRATVTLALAAIGLLLVRLTEDNRRYDFGYPDALDAAVVALLWMLFVTHAAVTAIMWLQRDRWLPSDAAMFLFLGVKALFWLNFATLYNPTGNGIRLDVAYLYVIIAATAIHLDVRVVRRYLIRTADEREPGDEDWDGSDRRAGIPGRRAYDQFKGRA